MTLNSNQPKYQAWSPGSDAGIEMVGKTEAFNNDKNMRNQNFSYYLFFFYFYIKYDTTNQILALLLDL